MPFAIASLHGIKNWDGSLSRVCFHSGGTTRYDGSHRDNNNVSGLGYYHCHHGLGPHPYPCKMSGESLIDLLKQYKASIFTTQISSSGTTTYVFEAAIELEKNAKYFALEITGRNESDMFYIANNGTKTMVESFWGTELNPKYMSMADSPWQGTTGGFDYLVNADYFHDIIKKFCGIEKLSDYYTEYNISLEDALDIQIKKSPQTQKNGNWVNASREEVLEYLSPNNYKEDVYKYQFLDLSTLAGISENEMSAFLTGKGILGGKEKIYIEAAYKYCVSEVYLAAHSSLETGNGTSILATGVIVNNVTVYNMYGIGAYDSDPVGGGSQYAYSMGWTTPEKAIDGGAKWISEQYINNNLYKQNTLYKMRWNPDSPGDHQYATDIGWAVKQTSSIKKMYDNFPNASIKFEIPIYK